jgi:uncharacterized protein (DUF4415 family)/uncharacterized DUF497 family protein
LTALFLVHTLIEVRFAFDPAKDAINRSKHRFSLGEAARLDWSRVLAKLGTRTDYGEPRQIGCGPIGRRLYCSYSSIKATRGGSSACARPTPERSSAMRHKLVRPTETEEAAINAGVAADSDTYELTPAEFRQLRPVRGRPRSDATKQRITIRLSPDVLAKFKAAGKGWQTRVDLALRDWLKTHRVQ